MAGFGLIREKELLVWMGIRVIVWSAAALVCCSALQALPSLPCTAARIGSAGATIQRASGDGVLGLSNVLSFRLFRLLLLLRQLLLSALLLFLYARSLALSLAVHSLRCLARVSSTSANFLASLFFCLVACVKKDHTFGRFGWNLASTRNRQWYGRSSG